MNEVTELRNCCLKGTRAVGRRGQLRGEKRRGDSHHKPRPWSAGTACAGPHPRKEGNPPTGCRGSPLRHKHTHTHTHKQTYNALFIRKCASVFLFLLCLCIIICVWISVCLCTTHRRPRCPQVCHMPPSSIPQGTGTPVCQQILQ